MLSRAMIDEQGFFELTAQHVGTRLTLGQALEALYKALAVLHGVAEGTGSPLQPEAPADG